MGDCASRPSPAEINEHKKQINTVNNSYFIYIPYVHSEIANETNPLILQTKRRFYSKKAEDYGRILESPEETSPPVPGLNVEVQKGLNLEKSSNCMNRGQPFLVVKLEPNGDYVETSISNAFKPN